MNIVRLLLWRLAAAVMALCGCLYGVMRLRIVMASCGCGYGVMRQQLWRHAAAVMVSYKVSLNYPPVLYIYSSIIGHCIDRLEQLD